jgi:hypothetical protein
MQFIRNWSLYFFRSGAAGPASADQRKFPPIKKNSDSLGYVHSPDNLALFLIQEDGQPMKNKNDRFFSVPLGSSRAEVRDLLGRPERIVTRASEYQWSYEQGRFVLTFAGAERWLTRIARRIAAARPGRADETNDHNDKE